MTSRRHLLLGAAGVAAVGLTGCSAGTDPLPTPAGPTDRPGSPSPAPTTPPADPRAVAAARTLAALLSRSAGVLARSDLGDRTALVQAIRDGHAQHLSAFRSPAPTSRPLPSGTPSATKSSGSLSSALTALATAERDAARAVRTSAAAAAGFASLLYASVGAACASYATALGDDDPATPTKVATSRPVLAPWSELDGLQDALAAAHALVYGYQAALGFVSESSAFGKELTARVLHFQQLRDRLTALVVAAQVQPVAAEPAYRLPVRVTGTSTATRLVRQLEVAAQPHFGRFVAASTTPAVHTLALGELAGAVSTGLVRGAGVAAWPGWPS